MYNEFLPMTRAEMQKRGWDAPGSASGWEQAGSGEVLPWAQMSHTAKASSKKHTVSAKPTMAAVSCAVADIIHSSSLPAAA